MAFDAESATLDAPAFDPGSAALDTGKFNPDEAKMETAKPSVDVPDFIPQRHQQKPFPEMGGDFKHGFFEPLVTLPKIDTKEEANADPDHVSWKEGHPVEVGLYNAAAPIVSSFTSPANIALAVGTGGLSAAAQAGSILARRALVGIGAYFAGDMGVQAVKAVPKAVETLQSDKSTPAEKIEAIAEPVMTAALSAVAALGAVHELRPDLTKKLAAATPEAGVDILKEEATKAPPEEKATLEDAANKIEAEQNKPVNGFDANTAIPDEVSGHDLLNDASRLPERPLEAPVETPTEPAKPTVEADSVASEPVSEPVEATAPAAKETGIKNEFVDAEMERLSRPESEHGEARPQEGVAKEAATIAESDPLAGERLVKSLDENMRPATDTEIATLLREATKQRMERDAAETQLLEATKSGDESAIADAKERAQTATDKYVKTLNIADRTGTLQGQGLAMRRRMMKEDYSLAALERRKMIANDGEPLTETQRADIKELHDELSDLQKQLDERVAQVEKEQPIERKRPPGKRSAVSQYLSEQAEAARQRIKARMSEGRVSAGLDPIDLADHVIVGADYIAQGVRNLADWSKEMVSEFGDAIKPHLEDLWRKSKDAHHEAMRLEAFKKRTTDSINELEGKLAAKDFSKKPKPTPIHLDAEANLLKAKIDLLRQEFQKELELDAYKRSPAWNKVKENALNAYDLARSLMTTGEFSFILRQGKFAALSHPILTAKSLPATFKALVSDAASAHALDMEIINHPDYATAKAAGLHIVDESASLSAQEELLMGKLIGKFPLLRNFNQAARVFLNKIRFDLFETLKDSSGGLNAVEQKQIATFINESTGRGDLGKFNSAAVAAGRILFAPRFLASRIQMATGHSLWGGTMQSRRIIAGEYAKTLVGLATYYAALKMALGNDDKKPVIGTDPRSTEFGKVKLGNTRIDPLAGLSQIIVFGTRTATGEKTNSRGKVLPIRGPRVPYGGDRWTDIAANFARSKLHPVPGAITNLFNGTDLGGNEATVENQALNMMAPLTYVDIYQALKEQGLEDGVAISLLAVLGEGIQTYDSQHRKPKPAPVSK